MYSSLVEDGYIISGGRPACQVSEPKRLVTLATLGRLCFQLRLFFLFILNADFDRGDDKSPLLDGQVKEFGRLPAKLLQTEVGKVGLRVTVLN